MNKTKCFFFEKTIQIDKTLAKWTKKQSENIHSIEIRNKNAGITTDFTEINKIVR